MLIFLDKASLVFDAILLYIYYQTLFGKRKSNISMPFFAAGFIIAELAFALATTFSIGDVSPAMTYFRVILNITINFILSLYYTAPAIYRILVVICYTTLVIICEDISYYIINHFTHVTINVDTLPDSTFISISLISNLIQFFFIMLLHIFWKRKSGIRSFTYAILLLFIPILSVCLALSPTCFELNLIAPNSYMILVLFLLVINIINYILLENVLKADDLEQKSKRLEEQITYQRQKYMQLGESYRNIRSFMHDAKKHLFYIEECVNKKKYDRIIPYTKETIKDLETRYCTVNTGNLVIDAFISNFMLQTNRYSIELNTSLKVDCNLIPIDDYHLTIILGNLLDNALNACLQQYFSKINIMIQTVENTFTIHITNTYVIPPNEKQPERIEDIDFIHGYGLKNVKDSVAACGGIILIDYENSIYSVTIIFPLKNETSYF